MKTLKRALKFIFWYGGWSALMYAAFGLNIVGALYLIKFMVWATCAVYLLVLLAHTFSAKQFKAEKAPDELVILLARIFNGALTALLVWNGHFFTAAVASVKLLCVEVFMEVMRQSALLNAKKGGE
jgi:hypothetical protein